MSKHRKKAEKALYSAIAACADAATEEHSGDKLKTAAEAFQLVAHGPAGGHLERQANDRGEQHTRYDYTADTKSTSTQTADIHDTRHHGEDRKRPAGFNPRDPGQ